MARTALSGYMKDNTGRRLDEFPVPIIPLNRVGFIGDSITINPFSNGDVNTGNVALGDSAPTYAMLASDGRWRHVANRGISGNRTDQVLARIPALIAEGVDIIVFPSCGVWNDAYQSIPIATTLANIAAMIATCRKAGVIPVLSTPTPNGSGDYNEARAVFVYKVRRMMIDLCAANGVPLIDMFTILADPTGGALPAPYNVDGSVHPSAAGYVVMGKAIDNTLRALLPPISDRLVTDKGTGTPDLYAGAGLFYGTPDANGIANGWTLNGTGSTFSVTTPAGVIGKAQRITLGASSSGSAVARSVATGSGFAVGDVVEVSGEVLVSAAAVKAEVQLIAVGPNTSIKPVSITPGGVLARGQFCKRFTVPAGTTSLGLYLKASGTAPGTYVEYSRIGLMNLTALGLAT